MPLGRTAFGEDTDVVGDTDFQVLLIANMSAPLGTALVSPLLDSLLVPLSVSEASVGLVMSAFTAPSIVLTPVVGTLSDRYGRKPLLLVGLLLFGLAGTAIAVANDFTTVIGLRLLQGVGYAGVTPILVTSIGDLYTGNTEATAQGLRFTTSGVVQTVFPVIASLLVLFSWRYPFLLYASALPVCGVVYLWFDEPTSRSSSARPVPGTVSGAVVDTAAAFRTVPRRVRRFARLVLSRFVLAAIVARATPSFVYFGFVTYNSIIVGAMGGTATDAGILVGLASVVYAISASQSGRVNAFFATRTAPLILTNIGMALSFGIVALAPTVVVAGIGVAVLGFCFGISLSLYRSLLTSLVSEPNRGAVVSLGESSGRAAVTAVPLVMGGLLAVSGPVVGFEPALRGTVLAVGVVPNVVGIAAMLLLRNEERRTTA